MKHMLSCFVILQMAAIAGAQTAKFEDTVDQYFRETKLVTQQFKDLWNYDLYAPLLMVDRNTRKVYANVQDTMEQLKYEGCGLYRQPSFNCQHCQHFSALGRPALGNDHAAPAKR